MSFAAWIKNFLRNLGENIIKKLLFFRFARFIPGFTRLLDMQNDKVLDQLQPSFKPYRGRYPSFAALPEKKQGHSEVLEWLGQISSEENDLWEQGYVSGSVYHGDKDHIGFLNKVYNLYSQGNPLHADIWPSLNKFEAEIVSMTGSMLGADQATGFKVGGSLTSGGTESILMAMKTYRDWARKEKRIKHPEAIVPITAHAAFDKACHYFGIKKITVPIDENYQASLAAVRKAISRNTIVIVGSAPNFPHGIIDPIAEMAAIAKERGVGFHTDACLGGFILPWLSEDDGAVPFDFRVEGVTSISVDTHKFGYASKGSSVLLFRDGKMRHYQYFTSTDWPGGLYFSPSIAGSRPGALIAQCWAALVSMGEEGYREAAQAILSTGRLIKEGIRSIPGLEILGNPLWVIAFTSRDRNIYEIMDYLTAKGWRLNGLHKPSCVHICLTLRHTQAGVAERFINDLREATIKAGAAASEGGMAPIYGLAAQIPHRRVIATFLNKYIDRLYEV